MAKNKKILPKDTLIVWNKFPVGEYRNFFQETTGKEIKPGDKIRPNMDFQNWLFSQSGKTLEDALEEYLNPSEPKNMEEILSERRFNVLSESNKMFIVAFDKAINDLGYDYGGIIGTGNVWSTMMIVYGKTNTKSRPCAARIYIKEDGIIFRLYLNKVDMHRQYIENASEHIKSAFTTENGRCTFCWEKCPSRPKAYTIDGEVIQKCQHHTFYFDSPSIDRIPDYMNLLSEFYSKKK